MLKKAIDIATRAHEGQTDKAGKPYIEHPLRVMERCGNEPDKICAVLHDVVEDTDLTLEDLRAEGFSEAVLEVLGLVTKRPGEGYKVFIERICANPAACRVKLADLADNMDLSRLAQPTEEDFRRLEKYERAVERIRAAIE